MSSIHCREHVIHRRSQFNTLTTFCHTVLLQYAASEASRSLAKAKPRKGISREKESTSLNIVTLKNHRRHRPHLQQLPSVIPFLPPAHHSMEFHPQRHRACLLFSLQQPFFVFATTKNDVPCPLFTPPRSLVLAVF